jgi:hypothetical protein
MAYCRVFGTHYEVKPCNSGAELTGGQPQSQPAHTDHNQTMVGLVPIAQTTGTIGTQQTQVTYVYCPISCCKTRTHAPTGTPWVHQYRYAHVHHFRYAHVDESTPIAPR